MGRSQEQTYQLLLHQGLEVVEVLLHLVLEVLVDPHLQLHVRLHRSHRLRHT